MSSSQILTEEQKKTLLGLIGPNEIPNSDLFFQSLIKLHHRNKWYHKDLHLINSLINDGFGYMLEMLYKHILNNQQFIKYYGKRVFQKPISLDDLHTISQGVKDGSLSKSDLINDYGGHIVSPDEFLETNAERKERKEEEKSIINNDVPATSKNNTRIIFHKSK